MTTAEPDYVVIRPAADLPPGAMPECFNGRWYDRARIGPPSPDSAERSMGKFTAVPAGRFEVRDDGAVAEVWEVRP